ncbi:hypothetical protein BDR04DRAFT_1234383 [Suillus decipiens]|nr:hypothetical protein BDR04DRAFT_1234383 [Suillus decipiens]
MPTIRHPDLALSTAFEIVSLVDQARNASAREKLRVTSSLKSKNFTASPLRPPNSNTTRQSTGEAQAQPSSRPQPAVSNTTTSSLLVANTASGTNPHIMIRHAGHWIRFWLFICCTSTEYIDDN